MGCELIFSIFTSLSGCWSSHYLDCRATDLFVMLRRRCCCEVVVDVVASVAESLKLLLQLWLLRFAEPAPDCAAPGQHDRGGGRA